MDTQSPAKKMKRTVQKHIWLGAEEWDVIARRMHATGYKTFSSFARELFCQGKLTMVHTMTIDPELRRQISAIGNNINQIAHKANTDNMATFEQVVASRRLLQEVHYQVACSLGSRNGSSEDRGHPNDPSIGS